MLWVRVRNAWLASPRAADVLVWFKEDIIDEGLLTSDDDRDKVEAYQFNVAGYILKPVTFAAFVEAMATLNKYWTISEIV